MHLCATCDKMKNDSKWYEKERKLKVELTNSTSRRQPFCSQAIRHWFFPKLSPKMEAIQWFPSFTFPPIEFSLNSNNFHTSRSRRFASKSYVNFLENYEYLFLLRLRMDEMYNFFSRLTSCVRRVQLSTVICILVFAAERCATEPLHWTEMSIAFSYQTPKNRATANVCVRAYACVGHLILGF